MPAVDLSRLDPQPEGFGGCGDCAYRDVGSAGVCFACASEGMDLVGSGHCQTCDQRLPASGTCANYWCRRPQTERYFDFISAIAMRSGVLQVAINKYKFESRKGWAAIFGRVLVGYLDENSGVAAGWDAIIASPTFIGPGSRRTWDHISLILERTALEAGGRWPIHLDPPMVIKTGDSTSLVGASLAERRRIAETEIRSALVVPVPAAVEGRSILVFDDVFTDGSTLREVARSLLLAGASRVGGIVLARQPWQTQP